MATHPPVSASVSAAPGRALRALPAHLLAIAAQGDPALQARAIAGIRAYQAHPFRRPPSPAETAWTGGGATLFFLPSAQAARGTIFLVPSLINGGEILDLLPARSFARWLAAAGFDVYRLDWGGAEAAGLSELVETRLAPGLAFASETGPVHGVGHCMGGTLLTAAACLAPESLRSLTMLASPWDFHAGDRGLADMVRTNAAAAAQIGAARGAVPAEWLQQGFARLAGSRLAAKFAAFARLPQHSAPAELFVAVEDWLNEGRDMPAGVAADIITGWYGRNMPALLEWRIGGARIDPGILRQPSLHVVPRGDRLVPRESALALASAIPGATTLAPPVGHLGMMSGGDAMGAVWRQIADWLGALS